MGGGIFAQSEPLEGTIQYLQKYGNLGGRSVGYGNIAQYVQPATNAPPPQPVVNSYVPQQINSAPVSQYTQAPPQASGSAMFARGGNQAAPSIQPQQIEPSSRIRAMVNQPEYSLPAENSIASTADRNVSSGLRTNTAAQMVNARQRLSATQGNVDLISGARIGFQGLKLLGNGQTSGLINNVAGGISPELFGSGAPFSAVEAGATAPGTLTSAGLSASTILSGAGVGYLAGSLFPSERQYGSEILGTAGGIAGSVIGGPIGSVIGAGIGAAVGSFFGAKPGTQVSEFLTEVQESEVAYFGTGSKRSTEDYGSALGQDFNNLLGQLRDISLDVSGTAVRGGFNTKQQGGGFFQLSDGTNVLDTIKFDMNEREATGNALAETAVKLIDRGQFTDASVQGRYDELKAAGASPQQILAELFGMNTGGGSQVVSGGSDADTLPGTVMTDTITPKPQARPAVQQRVEVAQAQIADYMDVQVEKAEDKGVASTILTSRRGVTEPVRVRRAMARGSSKQRKLVQLT